MPNLNTLYVVHHSHTDIGFTLDQPLVWELHQRFLDDALNAAEHFEHHPFESRFRWTVEATWPLMRWLQNASPADIQRFQRLEQKGLLEVTAMPLNITPLYDQVQYAESLKCLEILRNQYGLTITSAMNCDVNGHNWALADLLLDHGISGFSMAINHHFGGAPDPRPWVFDWQAPSGRTLLAFNGWAYGKAKEFGLADATTERFQQWLPQIEQHLQKIDCPLPFLMVQGEHPYGDNASVHVDYARFAKLWNEERHDLKVVLATPRMFWQEVGQHRDRLQTLRGDWTDFWNFGCVSTPRETAIDRQNRARLYRADVVHALTPEAKTRNGMFRTRWAGQSFERYRTRAWQQVNLFGEHTWGADCGIGTPDTDDALSQKNHKFHAAYEGRSLSLMLERDALGDFSQEVARSSPEDLLVFNPLPFERVVSGKVPYQTLQPRGDAQNTTATRHFQGHYDWPTQMWTGQNQTHLGGNLGFVLSPVTVPACGYRVVPRSSVLHFETSTVSQDQTVSNHRHTLHFDVQQGGILSWQDKALQCEWVDPSDTALFRLMHEEVADRGHPWPRQLVNDMDWGTTVQNPRGWQEHWVARRNQDSRVLQHQVYRNALGTTIEQVLEHPAASHFAQRVFLPDHADWIELETELVLHQDSHPQNVYLMFPFALPSAQVVLNMAQTPTRPELDQLPLTCRDFFTVQDWLDFQGDARGMRVALPDNPMVQLGGFHFGRNLQTFELGNPTLLSWLYGNFWETNFQPFPSSMLTARYRLLPYAGPFDEGASHRFGQDALHARPLVQHLHEPASPVLPEGGTLLHLPESPVLVLQLCKTGDGVLELTLLNASNADVTAKLSSALLHIHEAWTSEGPLEVLDGTVLLKILPRRRQKLMLRVRGP
ncbi:hypothetical protein [Deinococcus misasensis]|uniref:glycoside hydrolase family 38 N-terminal domain-containing protein n=1 Tax=Deinococcus misasensis TaxID=392413 RepID=UPI000AF66A50|nr:hypothetical protein [Deinococcus misasensis]